MNRLEWDKYFLSMAKMAAIRSGCNSRPTGAVIVKDKRIIATGYNGSISGQQQCTDQGSSFCYRRSVLPEDNGEFKYKECLSIHAEQNAINQAAKYGINISGSVLYCTLSPCIYCLKNIASVGILEICYEYDYESNDEKRDLFWKDQYLKYGINSYKIEMTKSDYILVSKAFFGKTSKRRI